jgi:hypothetical protein
VCNAAAPRAWTMGLNGPGSSARVPYEQYDHQPRSDFWLAGAGPSFGPNHCSATASTCGGKGGGGGGDGRVRRAACAVARLGREGSASCGTNRCSAASPACEPCAGGARDRALASEDAKGVHRRGFRGR